ncbi:MAG: flagellar hook capping FlgD N-terminal domain-containing protein [Planctomycetota bacterium]
MTSPVELDSSQYMELLLTELKNQNPMQPMKNTEMMTQFSQLTTARSMGEMENSFEDVLKMQKLSGGVDLLGRRIRYNDGQQSGIGTVESISRSDGQTRLEVDGRSVDLDSVVRVV